MDVTILAVGRWKRGPERELFERYVERCPWRIELVELVLTRSVAAGALRRAESDLLRTRLDGRRPFLMLDERGEDLTSEAFAEMFGRFRDAGTRGIAFVIGGADGVDDALRAAATRTVAFGRTTWPHLLTRVLLAEQLYRASTILARHPYHRGAE